ncbi:calpain-A-like [Haliotis cracherodii]|uniref:calpain-A-like n=1 Tax=Haliotis cracherodii TaxID=6455 RepID=UPI0039E943C1
MGCTNSRSSSQQDFQDVNPTSYSQKGETSMVKDRPTTHGKGSGVKRKQSHHTNGNIVANRQEDTNTNRHIKLQSSEEVLQSLSEGELFEDPYFPACNSSLHHSDGDGADVQWIRPKDLLSDGAMPEMMVDGVTKDDIQQGILGDCWFLSSCAAVSQQERFMKKIMPERNQPLCGEEYKGIVCFQFWRYGKWIQVYIDDRLPVQNGKLIYAHCTEQREFWVALIEKAYAKVHGSYEALEGGQTMDALVDLTGGLAERYELEDYNPNMFRQILRAHKTGAFIACSKKGDWKSGNNADANGLVSGHAYTITGIRKIHHEMGEEKLLRIRNPWGDATEWKGSWSDNDVNWEWVDDDTKDSLGLESRDDGEFWMSFKDFCRHFQEVTICLTGPDFDGDGVSDSAGHFVRLDGSWEEGVNAGGSRNDLKLFATNPQYLLTLTHPDDFNQDTDDAESEGKCSVVIALMQEHRVSSYSVKDKRLQIGFMLYKTEAKQDQLPAKHFRYHPDCGKSGVYINYREVSGRFELDPGHYVIIPSTFMPNCSAKFMLRVYGEKSFHLEGPL